MIQLRRKHGVPEISEFQGIGQPILDLDTGVTYIKVNDNTVKAINDNDNITNGEGIGSLVQKTKSSSGTPYNNIASGSAAVAFGKNVIASGNTAVTFGQENEASGNCAVSMGLNSEASGDHSLTQGVRNKSIGDRAITFGYENENKGDQSFIVGQNNVVGEYAQNSFVAGENNNTTSSNVSLLGRGLIATAQGQTLIGKFNRYNDIDSALFVLGNGSNNTDRSNAFVVLNDGRAKVYGTPTETDDIVRKTDLDTAIQTSVTTVLNTSI